MPLEHKMFSYYGPSALKTSVPLLPSPRKSSSTVQSSSSTNSVPPPPDGVLALEPPEFANAYQLDIISALRGNEHNFVSRSAVADAIVDIEEERHKFELIDFLASEQGAIASTLENNACKLFHCTPSELFVVAKRWADAESAEDNGEEQFLTKFVNLFHITLRKIIPNTYGMLYPLEHFDSTFRVQEIILRHFRDRVLLTLLDSIQCDQELLGTKPGLRRDLLQMFWLISFNVDDINSETWEGESFEKIYAEFVGEKINGIRLNQFNANKLEEKTEEDREEEMDQQWQKNVINSSKKTQLTDFRSNSFLTKNNRQRWNFSGTTHSRCSNDDEKVPTPRKSSKSRSQSPGKSDNCILLEEENEEDWKKIQPPPIGQPPPAEALLVQKRRARTLPSTTKSVSFWDDGTIADV